jgi:hypothetical protein
LLNIKEDNSKKSKRSEEPYIRNKTK